MGVGGEHPAGLAGVDALVARPHDVHVRGVSLRAPEPRVLAACGALVVLSGAFLFLTHAVSGGAVGIDAWAPRALKQIVPDPAQSTRATEIFRDLTALGSLPVLSILVFVAAGHLVLIHRYRAAAAVVSACAGGTAAAFLLKALISRPRPEDLHLAQVHTSSFPSAHAMVSMVVFLTLGVLLLRLTHSRRVGSWYLFVAVVVSGAVGVTRVYLGVHHATDVLAGWIAGLLWATCVWLILRAFQRAGWIRSGGDEP